MAQIKDNVGMAINEENFKLIKKVGMKGDVIEKHNHIGFDVLFTVVKGRVDVTINDEERYNVVPGACVSFDGDNFLSAILLEDSEIFITLIKKP